jgi:pimeloyl-ACP methyl ester carboxylesterase
VRKAASIVSLALGLALVIAVAVAHRTEEREAARFPAPGWRVDVGGRRLHVRCAGRGSPLILLEATGPGNSTQYDQILPQLAARTRVCAYDRAGMGWSDPSPAASDARETAKDLERLVGALGYAPPYVLVAGSAGGLTAEYFTRSHPHDVVGLLMLDALNGDIVTRGADRFSGMIARAGAAWWLARLGLLRAIDPLHLAVLSPERRDLAIALTYRRSTWKTIRSLAASFSMSARELDELPPLRQDLPLVVLRHERIGDLSTDPALDARVEPDWQAAQAAMAARSRCGRLHVAERSGHHVAIERPDLVVGAVNELLDAPCP